jgi:hypothetical protein
MDTKPDSSFEAGTDFYCSLGIEILTALCPLSTLDTAGARNCLDQRVQRDPMTVSLTIYPDASVRYVDTMTSSEAEQLIECFKDVSGL